MQHSTVKCLLPISFLSFANWPFINSLSSFCRKTILCVISLNLWITICPTLLLLCRVIPLGMYALQWLSLRFLSAVLIFLLFYKVFQCVCIGHVLTPLWRFLLVRCWMWKARRVVRDWAGEARTSVQSWSFRYFLLPVLHLSFPWWRGGASVPGFLCWAQGSPLIHPSPHLTSHELPCWEVSPQTRETACPHGFSTLPTSPSIQVQQDLHSNASTPF